MVPPSLVKCITIQILSLLGILKMIIEKIGLNRWMSVAYIMVSLTAMAMAGEQPKQTGGICDKGQEENQAGNKGDAGQDNHDPIYLANGDFQRVQTDLFIPGRGLDFELKRFYRSKSGLFSTFTPGPSSNHDGVLGNTPRVKVPVGINWDHSYNIRVSLEGGGVTNIESPDPEPAVDDDIPPTSIYLYTGTGRRDEFNRYNGVTDPEPGNPALYSSNEYASVFSYARYNAYIFMYDSDQTRYKFKPIYDGYGDVLPYAGWVESITDRNGNQLKFFYETTANGFERLSSMEDTLGHPITFQYYDDSSSGLSDEYTEYLLWRVIDHAGRIVEYDYENISSDQQPRLITANLPSIVNNTDFPLQYSSAGIAVDHARFPNGVTWTYEYAPKQTSGWFQDGLITKITDPNGVDITENEYDASAFDFRRSGRVVRQKFGDDYYNYVVTELDGTRDQTGNTYDYYVWVNDRRGAITRFKYARKYNSYPTGAALNQQLLEKTEFLGFVDDPDLRVYGVPSGGGYSWKYLDTNGAEQSLSGSLPGDEITTEFEPDENWNVAGMIIGGPSGSSNSQTYQNHDFPPPSGGFANPQFNKTVTSRTTSSGVNDSPAISITEYWRYDFDFGGGGCGCGSSGHYTAYKDGEENVTRKVYDTMLNTVTGRANGNLLAVYRGLPASYFTDTLSSNVSNDAASVDEYTYNQWGQVLTHTHPEKIILDSQGAEQSHPRTDSYTYYNTPSDPANHGRLHTMIVDTNGEGVATPKNLTTVYEYDLIGNVIKETDPGGDITEFLYNQMSQLVRVQQFDNMSNLFAEKMYFYDANGNVVVEEELNLDSSGTPVAEGSQDSETTWFTTVHVYDKLDYLTQTSREKNTISGIFASYNATTKHANSQATNTSYITQRWTYDANRNLTKFEDGEAVSGGQASNVVEHKYDARDLLIETVAGVGGTAPLKTKYEYDERDRLIARTIDPDGVLQAQATNYFYDGINRLSSVLDPMGNEIIYEYDDNHNIKRVTACGPVGEDQDPSQSDASNTLAEILRVYDRLDRYTSQSIQVFDYSSPAACDQLPSGSQQQTMAIIYNGDSSLHELSVPSGDDQLSNITEYFYDSASRLDFMVDGAGNITENEYDSDSNLIKITHSDFSSETPSTTQVFHVDYAYDALNRQISMIDGVGNDMLYTYDSRSNMVEMTDARDNVTAYIYDALSRRTQVDRELSISESSTYDDSNRIFSETDDNGNTTQYEYDGLSRIVKVTMPDGAFYSVVYDANGNPATYTDARGVVVTQTFDMNNRLLDRMINVTGGLPGSTFESFTYDGRGRLRTAVNNFTEVTREYDSRSNVVREIQNADYANGFPAGSNRVVEYAFDLANNNEQITYPSGREIYRTHDELNRLAGIFNQYNSGTDTYSDPVTEFEYVGRRVKGRVHGNGTRTGYNYNGYSGALVEIGDKGFGRINKITTSKVSSSTILDAFTFTWDETQNRTSYKDTQSGMKNRRERTFGYDELNRLVSTDVNFPDPNTDFPSPTNNGITTYSLDGVHNRTDVSGYESNGAPLGPYNQSGNQALNNQYTITPREGGGSWTYLYDENGNMVLKAQYNVADFTGNYVLDFFDLSAFMAAHTALEPSADLNDDGIWDFFDVSIFLGIFVNGATLDNVHYSYDFRNQLVGIEFKNGITVSYTVTNTYDPMARRVVEEITEGVNVDSKQMVYGGASLWEVLEQIDLSTDDVLLTHVYGFGIDDEVSYRIENQLTPEDIWTHRDDLNSLTSITDDNGDILERYEYGDYGQVSFFNAAGLSIPAPAYNAHHLYTGRSLITGTGLYDYRFRVMDPETGIFIQRDPLGYHDSMNMYAYVSNSPITRYDPLGLQENDVPAWANPWRPIPNETMYEFKDISDNVFEDPDMPRDSGLPKDLLKRKTKDGTRACRCSKTSRFNNPNRKEVTQTVIILLDEPGCNGAGREPNGNCQKACSSVDFGPIGLSDYPPVDDKWNPNFNTNHAIDSNWDAIPFMGIPFAPALTRAGEIISDALDIIGLWDE